jgi:hypothetical protein
VEERVMTSPALRRVAVALSVLAALAGCRRAPRAEPTPEPGLAQEATDTAADTQALHAAVAAANDVVRHAADCDAARPAVAEARRTFDEVEPRLRTGAARTSLAALRKQVDHVADLCP